MFNGYCSWKTLKARVIDRIRNKVIRERCRSRRRMSVVYILKWFGPTERRKEENTLEDTELGIGKSRLKIR